MNPICDTHGKMHRNGKTAAGSLRYRCPKCNATITIDPKQAGAPLAEDNPTGAALTVAERVRRHRAKQKAAKQ